MTSKVSSKYLSRKVFIVSIILLTIFILVIGVLLFWFAEYNNFKIEFARHEELKHGGFLIFTNSESEKKVKKIDEKLNHEEKLQKKHEEEFIRPIKIIFESQPNFDSINDTNNIDEPYWQQYHGNFRSDKARFWDLNPEYKFDAFGRRFHLILKLNSEFIIPNLKVTYISENSSIHQEPDINPSGCFYSGYIKGEPSSEVAVSLCNGMRGHIISESGGYVVEPVEVLQDNANTFLHKLWRIYSEQINSINGDCTVHNDTHISSMENFKSENAVPDNHLRQKRSVEEYTIKLMVVVDKDLANFHGPQLEHYILLIMNTVRSLFKSKSIGIRMNIAVVNFTVLNHDEFQYVKSAKDSNLLTEFCKWQSKQKDFNDGNSKRHDIAILLTRHKVCLPDEDCHFIIGYAHFGTICQFEHSCAVIRENGFLTSFTIAHELGHILAIPHDDNSYCANFPDDTSSGKIMTKQLNQHSEPWTWSNCSRQYLKKFLHTGNVDCLRDTTEEGFKKLPKNYLGEYYDTNEQCELAHGRGWQACEFQFSQYEKECQKLWCHNSLKSASCRNDGRPWADGTACGNKVDYWCQKKECIPKNYQIPVVHGGWGEWLPFTECSRVCGGGIRKSTRECNNPLPSETGELCLGESVMYESCNTHECSPGTPNFRAQQCARLNNDTTHWVPFITKDKCKLACRSRGGSNVSDKLIDGTLCDDRSYDICVDGKCMKAGCDHILNSNSVLDKCGVCGGDNSTCNEIRKEYNIKEPHFGYNFVDIIPAGSWDLDIREYNYYYSVDTNYLALKDPETNIYIFNGNSSVKRTRSIIPFENILLEYSGVEAIPPERVNSSGRLSKNLILEVLSVSEMLPFYVESRYKIPNSQHFRWEVMNEWSHCNKVCFGEQKRIIRCIRKETGNIVAYESCAGLSKPSTETRVCNEYCYLRWKDVSRSECSSHCGSGITRVSYRCYQQDRNTSLLHLLPDAYCSHIDKPSEIQPCYEPCDKVRWRYYDWEPCSVTCGIGVKTRRADCVDEYNRVVEENLCDRIPKRIQENCYLDECPYWSIGEWSSCSVSCGMGIRKRKFWCVRKSIVVPMRLCSTRDIPHDTEPCQMAPCSVWIVGEWSQCSVTCGSGIVYRSVQCSNVNESLCSQNEKPAETQMCFLPHCSENEIPNIEQKYTFEWFSDSWGECSATCGKGMKRRNVECLNINLGKPVDDNKCVNYKRPSDSEPCEERSCAYWKTSTWNPCSATCGQGMTYRYVWCELNGKKVLDSKCSGPKPEIVLSCDTSRTCTIETTSQTIDISYGTWRTGRWGECSVTCGGGMKIRNVVCLDNYGNITSNCAEHEKPASSSPCNTNPCPDQVKWKYGEWSQCNQTCDGGYQHRQAQCHTLEGESVQDVYCNEIESPLLLRQCNTNRCVKIMYQWRFSSWNECSVSCDIGVQTRSIYCEKFNEYYPEDREMVNDIYCNSITRPQSEKKCQKEACVFNKFVYKWVSGPWSKCSVTCDKGYRKRLIHCEKINELRPDEKEMVIDSYCDKSTKPKNYNKCRKTPCNSEYMWVPGPWGECRGICGNKIKERTVQCYHKSGVNVTNNYCVHLKQPNVKRKCKLKKCDPINCLDIKQKYKTNIDQDYTINILGRNISIYCHEMDSSQPKEFLSLPAGERENYSEFYSKRLIDPETCPKTKYGCCVEERNPNVGKTMFRKIRLNVTTLQVLTNDFTFAISSGTPVPYSEAGDCYSKKNCPQGMFSINLSGTGLQIASSVNWSSKGKYASMDIKPFNERRKLIGICGGHCATCSTTHGLKLDVLPP